MRLPQLSVLNLRLQHDLTALDRVESSDKSRASSLASSTQSLTATADTTDCQSANNAKKAACPLFSPHLLLLS